MSIFLPSQFSLVLLTLSNPKSLVDFPNFNPETLKQREETDRKERERDREWNG